MHIGDSFFFFSLSVSFSSVISTNSILRYDAHIIVIFVNDTLVLSIGYFLHLLWCFLSKLVPYFNIFRYDEEFDAYIIVSFVNATLVLSIGETVEEVTDSG